MELQHSKRTCEYNLHNKSKAPSHIFISYFSCFSFFFFFWFLYHKKIHCWRQQNYSSSECVYVWSWYSNTRRKKPSSENAVSFMTILLLLRLTWLGKNNRINIREYVGHNNFVVNRRCLITDSPSLVKFMST